MSFICHLANGEGISHEIENTLKVFKTKLLVEVPSFSIMWMLA